MEAYLAELIVHRQHDHPDQELVSGAAGVHLEIGHVQMVQVVLPGPR